MIWALTLDNYPDGNLFWVGPGQSTKIKVRMTDPDPQAPSPLENVYINLHVHNHPDLVINTDSQLTYTRSFPAIADGAYNKTAEFDINELLDGMYNNIMQARATEDTNNQFDFPADPDYPLSVVFRNYLLNGYITITYSHNVDGVMVEEGSAGAWDDPLYNFSFITGGVSRIMAAYLKGEGLSVEDFFVTNKKFLTWMPDGLAVHPRQPMRLWYYNSEAALLQIHAKVYYTDGTTAETTVGQSKDHLLLQAAVGISEMRIHNLDITKKIAKYEVWLQNADASHKTEVRTFVVDYNRYERNDIFFFRNSLGVWDVFWAHGDRSETVNADKDTNTFPLVEPTTRRGTVQASRGSFYQQFDSNTGYFRKQHRAWVLDFLNSIDVLYPAGFAIHPVIVEAEKFKFGEDKNDLFELDFTFRIAHLERFYSAEPVVESPFGDFNDDFNQDFFIS
jgi:hypothetical protein